jgi:5,10-methylenetetrahydromethanopterin reductase
MVTASAIAHLVQLAPGRVEIGVGAGFTGRNAMGQRALRWSTVVESVRTVRGLLAGETVSIDGARARMLHWPGQAPARPIEVPFRVAVAGPRGFQAARDLGCAVFVSRPPAGTRITEFPGVTAMVSGTVLQPGETAASPRALAAAGPGVAVRYHQLLERGGDDGRAALAGLPNGERFLALVEQLPEADRHLHLHEGHLSQLNPIDREVIDAEAMALSPLLAPAADVPPWLAGYDAMGVTEVAFEPMGDLATELRTFAEAAGLRPRQPARASTSG